MKQKIVIRLSMASDKCRSKAMVLAAKADGVSKMGITGDGKDQLEVEGDGIDTVCLVNCLRKKIGHADIVKVEEVKPEEKKPEKQPEVVPLPYGWWYPDYYHYHPQW
ncbi:heavy metal-associated isoprenylated plant protein 16-like [Miscanthus floridulus]|uniref:heavy metal-associated isoprenylated plant protein 16-like n=1 Tax=Miscanthus floridulus TaxID=154761 RepID=UPI003457CD3C